MVSIRFAERSLLLGYSCLWLSTQIVCPSLWWPSLSATKSRYCLLRIPHFEDVLNGKKLPWFGRSLVPYVYFALRLLSWFGTALNMSYLIALFSICIEVQNKFLKTYDITKDYQLAYKALYYVPVLNRTFMVAIEALALFIWRQNEWLIFDKYAIFSLSELTQFKFYLITLMIGLPDAFFDHFEVQTYLSFDKTNRYFLIGVLHYSNLNPIYKDEPILIHLFGIVLRAGNIINNVIRYRALLNVIFSALSVRRHLKVINNQIMMSQPKQREQTTFASRSTEILDQARRPPLGSGQDIFGLAILSNRVDSHNSAIWYPMANGPMNHELRRVSMTQRVLVSADYRAAFDRKWTSDPHKAQSVHGGDPISLVNRFNSTSDTHSSSTNYSPRASRTQTAMTTPESSSPSIGKNQANMCIIGNLRQLELHLTRLKFFVNDIDQSAASLVFFMCLISLGRFIYSIFFLLELQSTYTKLLIGTLFCVSRLLIPFVLFLSGTAMEQEAKRLIGQLECIYLEDSTQRLIYKLYSDTLGSLSRTIKQLESIKFDCDNLMSINLDTMKRLIFFSVAVIFFVVQYDALNVLYDRSEVALNSTSSSILPT